MTLQNDNPRYRKNHQNYLCGLGTQTFDPFTDVIGNAKRLKNKSIKQYIAKWRQAKRQ